MNRRWLAALALCGLAACGGKDTVEPPAELVSFEESLDISQIWSRRVGRGSERLRLGLAPASDGIRIFAGARDGTAAAFELASGEPVWSTETEERFAAGPGIGSGVVVFGTSDGFIVTLDAGSGEVLWRIDVASEVLSAPVVGGDIIAFRTVDGRLTGVSREDGAEVWTIVQTLPILTLRGNSAPMLLGDLVISGFDNGRLGAYDIEEGIADWELPLASPAGRSELDRLVDVAVDLEIFGNTVYAATFNGRAQAISIATGDRLWQQDLSSFTGIGVDLDHVYVTDDFSAVVALNRVNGREAWRQTGLRLRDVTAATRHREAVVVGDFEGYVHWLNADDGSFMARERAGSSAITAQPLAVGPLLFVQSEDGTLTAFGFDERPTR